MGRTKGAPTPAPGDGVLYARLDQGRGATYLFGRPSGAVVETPFNLTGDRKREILTLTSTTLTLFSDQGDPDLIIRFPGALSGIPIALGDLDGRPGDEMILAIPHYGMVALGVSPKAKPFTSSLHGNAPSVNGYGSGPSSALGRATF